MSEFYGDLLFYFNAGGAVMYPLVLGTFVLWYALGYRMAAVKRGGRKQSVRVLIDTHLQGGWDEPAGIIEDAIIKAVAMRKRLPHPLRPYLDDMFSLYVAEIKKYGILIRTIVGVAPLLGLLGTVTGMIETFDSLTTMEFFSQSGGIAGGISQALVTTQLGLAVAIPGLMVNGYINRRQHTIEMELEQIKDIMSTMKPVQPAG